ncbi:alpha/beta hydrolase [Actibacterium sp. MT2.3-13A]|uniref:alpha/beta fold hydrolase n=1 Tax=Actibacterium sp. MT2.3-13A TaxID=2828332 RepID=UPI001BAADC6C|nr:alpha/beta hydrolase [Actibacterium sp. MT2.3-13A]
MSDATERFPPTGKMLTVNGHRVHVHVSDPRPPVILIHGAGGNSRDFTFSLTARLQDRYHVYAFDRPGLGHTPPLHHHGETPEEQAAFLDSAAADLGIGPAVIVGHSYGGAVALAWAMNHPARVAAVVVLAGAVNPWGGELGLLYRAAASWTGGLVAVPLIAALAPRSLVSQALHEVFAPQSPPEGYEDYIGAELTLRPESLRANARQVHGLNAALHRQAPRYPSIAAPVEILHGTADRIAPIATHARPLARAIAQAHLVELPGIGHMPHHAAPDATVAAIDRAAARAGLR